MRPDDLQHLVDTLAAKLRRAVSIDDPSMRLLAASRHFGDEDPARVRSVLDRYAGDDETKFVLSQGIANWTGPGRVPAHPPNLSARLCVPLRCHGLSLGYLWLIDAHGTVTEREVAAATEAAEQMSLLLYRRLLLHEREQARTGSLLRDLVSTDAAARRRAVEEIRDDHLLATEDTVLVLALEVFGASDGAAREQASVALGAAVELCARAAPPRSVLAFAHGSRALVLLAAPRPGGLVDELVGAVEREFDRRTGAEERIVIGVGGEWHGLAQAAESHRQATTATRAARLMPGLGTVVRWERLGPYALLLQLPREQIVAEDWAPGLRSLSESDSRGTLLSTLESYLDNAGDVRRTARKLGVHRTTLYHRLRRIEQVAGVDLADGGDRLTLHLGLKMTRLADAWGACPPSGATRNDSRGA